MTKRELELAFRKKFGFTFTNSIVMDCRDIALKYTEEIQNERDEFEKSYNYANNAWLDLMKLTKQDKQSHKERIQHTVDAQVETVKGYEDKIKELGQQNEMLSESNKGLSDLEKHLRKSTSNKLAIARDKELQQAKDKIADLKLSCKGGDEYIESLKDKKTELYGELQKAKEEIKQLKEGFDLMFQSKGIDEFINHYPEVLDKVNKIRGNK